MKLLMALFLLLLAGCVGTDAVDDKIVSLSVSIDQQTLVNGAAATTVGGQLKFNASATNDRGTNYKPNVNWNSSQTTVATIDENGNLQAVAPGTTFITATARSIQSKPLKISVVSNANGIALIEISGASSSIKVDENIDLTARALNAEGKEVPDAPITFSSDDEAVATVNSEGRVKGVGRGSASITARSGNITASFTVSVGEASRRSGTFEGSNGYTVQGTAVLQTEAGGGLSLQFQDDFNISNGPGLFVYLTNSSSSISGGIELGELKSFSGAARYDVPDGITLDQFDQVLIFCKPFGVPFGAAALDGGS